MIASGPSGAVTLGFDGTTLSVDDTTATAYAQLHYALDGADSALVSATSSALRIEGDGGFSVASLSGAPSALEAAIAGDDVYAVQIDAAGDAWLIYGSAGGALTEVPLVTGIEPLTGADVLVTSDGNLVVAASDGASLVFMATSL
jgi:hypothetical protein